MELVTILTLLYGILTSFSAPRKTHEIELVTILTLLFGILTIFRLKALIFYCCGGVVVVLWWCCGGVVVVLWGVVGGGGG